MLFKIDLKSIVVIVYRFIRFLCANLNLNFVPTNRLWKSPGNYSMNYLPIVQASSCSKISGWSPGVILETFQDFPDL